VVGVVALLGWAPAWAQTLEPAPAPTASNAASPASDDPIGDLIGDALSQVGALAVSPAAMMLPDWKLVARMYHVGAKGVGGKDSLGCKVVPMRTVAIDPKVVPKGSVVYIPETVGLPVPGGGVHDGRWYASDTGGAIRGAMIDLFTGFGAYSMQPLMKKGLNLSALSATRIGEFKGCPPAWPNAKP
jgi:3D (Asp-Asp-Asp) domain-containing protein